ncbi:MAG: hypothetical protein BJ554DRAFT_4465, partial [Olpidium bornovanus]
HGRPEDIQQLGKRPALVAVGPRHRPDERGLVCAVDAADVRPLLDQRPHDPDVARRRGPVQGRVALGVDRQVHVEVPRQVQRHPRHLERFGEEAVAQRVGEFGRTLKFRGARPPAGPGVKPPALPPLRRHRRQHRGGIRNVVEVGTGHAAEGDGRLADAQPRRRGVRVRVGAGFALGFAAERERRRQREKRHRRTGHGGGGHRGNVLGRPPAETPARRGQRLPRPRRPLAAEFPLRHRGGILPARFSRSVTRGRDVLRGKRRALRRCHVIENQSQVVFDVVLSSQAHSSFERHPGTCSGSESKKKTLFVR